MMYFFFAHYDGPEGRRAYASHQWYQQYVGNHSCAYSGLKAEFIFNELIAQEQLARDPFLQRFPFVWFAVSVSTDLLFLNSQECEPQATYLLLPFVINIAAVTVTVTWVLCQMSHKRQRRVAFTLKTAPFSFFLFVRMPLSLGRQH
jgi:hypothetical protein